MPDFNRAPWPALGSFATRTLVPIVIVIVVAWIFLWLAERYLGALVRRLMDRERREGTARELSAVEIERRIDTVSSLAVAVVRVLVVTIAMISVLGNFDVNIGPAIAGLGIVGIAVGFGAQSLVKDYLNGVLILVENQFARGDAVQIAGVSGVVEDFTLRRTTVRDIDGVVHSVPNGEITVASNLTRLWARINEDVVVAYGTNIERATEIVNEVGREMAADPLWAERVLEPPRVERVQGLGEYGITLKVLGAVRAEARWDAPGELRKRLLVAFRTHGIEIPRPQRVVLSADPTTGPGGMTRPADPPPDLPVEPGGDAPTGD
ncbi:MAG: mechanosensitive ion channel family protein [Chloroflexi bacterium]|nr:mechanosensitive ion channel family protein [Chloroflexota bacterium]